MLIFVCLKKEREPRGNTGQALTLGLENRAVVIFQMRVYQRSRGWCLTLNNYTQLEYNKLLNNSTSQYVICGKEIGERGTPHIQGYIHFSNEKPRSSVKKIVGERCHLEARMGTIHEAIEYCKKEGDWEERGIICVRGTSTKEGWGEVIELAEDGKMDQIKLHFPRFYLQYFKTLMSIQAFNAIPMQGVLEHEWWYGPTGTGKSKTLWEKYPQHYQKAVNKWWDGYSGEETVAIEEWEPKNECTAAKLKIWADRYPFSGEIKGGTLQKIRPKRIIVTSNYTIKECFPNPQDHEPLLRRFKCVKFDSILHYSQCNAPSFEDSDLTHMPYSIDDFLLPDIGPT